MTVYLNGAYLQDAEARVSVFDRGFLFGDGVYEVTAVIDRQLVDWEGHLDRLFRSLAMIDLHVPWSREEILSIHRQLVERDDIDQGLIYLQVTRGAADRGFPFPVSPEPTILLFPQVRNLIDTASIRKGIRVISVDDLRWKRRDIKSISLLAQVLAKQKAREAGASEAWMVEDGYVTEGGSSTAYIIKGDRLITRPLSEEVLPGVTRDSILGLIGAEGLKLDERPFTLAEAQDADEAFVTGSSMLVTPVIEIDGNTVAEGTPGPHTSALLSRYLARLRRTSASPNPNELGAAR